MEISRDGHRARMRAAYLQGGGDAMPDHQLLELLLSISIPRKDVKQKRRASAFAENTLLCSTVYYTRKCGVCKDDYLPGASLRPTR